MVQDSQPIVTALLLGFTCVATLDLLVHYWRFAKRQRVLPSPVAMIKESTARVVVAAEHVSISKAAVQQVINSHLTLKVLEEIMSPHAFDASIHLVDGTWRTAQYLFVVDALNFCFWPEAGLEYEHLARGLKDYIRTRGIAAISARNLSRMTVPVLRSFFGWKKEVPLEIERVRLLQEVGQVLEAEFGGRAANLVRAARGSAVELVRLVAAHFPGFRDQTMYRGRQVYFYKRAQIFVADIFGAYRGRGLGAFHDVNQLTMFADYRVPVVLANLKILEYSPALKAKVDAKKELQPGCAEEIEIRAATVQAVELLREGVAAKHGGALAPLSVHLDWWLWDMGERHRTDGPPHHRTLTTNY